ncbi:DUF2760 domain-containing protein [Candidatus Protochlamydia phocaeensis]|uniref:DUF2760 domain-containing protein n=1 Tax=Candidatus Protochlamydia phocaeensis TaxID=1414722 RepID=UPI0008391D8E|nr:DUF2760 domain-containing protein [Candidatus Protochlamydia phocaeensis]
MGLGLAFKAFMKAFKDPEKAKQFVEEQPPKQIEAADQSHLRLLYYLQQAGRLIDFLKEDISAFSDAQVGAAARKIHQDSAQLLEELVTIRPLKSEPEGTMVQVPKGYDPSEIKVVGKIKGEPPFSGVLVHRGWKAHKRSLPKKTGEQATDVICPAEIEIK